MRVHHVRSVAVLLSMLCLGACRAPAATSQADRPIYNGTPDTDPAHQAVVALVEDTGGGVFESFCTGTLISPTSVLTAAHCLDDITPAEFEIYFGDDVLAGGIQVAVADFVQHDGWDPDNYDSPDDIGIVWLAGDAPEGIDPLPPLPAALGLTEDDVGIDLVFSGFGETEAMTYDVKLSVTIPLDRVCAGPAYCPWSGELIVPRGFGYSQELGGPCVGDSGGPSFVLRDGTEYVAGVNIYGSDCWGEGVSTLVDAYQEWIEDNAGLAEAEDCRRAGDEDGDGLLECEDPDCEGHRACDGDSGCNQSQVVGLPLPVLLLGLILLVIRRFGWSRRLPGERPGR